MEYFKETHHHHCYFAHRTAEHMIRRTHNKDKNVTPPLHGRSETDRQTRKTTSKTDANRTFSDDIRIKFGLDKGTKIIFNKAKLVHSHNIVISINRKIQDPEEGKTYKYLVFKESMYTASTNERKTEEGVHQEIKNDTEITSECPEKLQVLEHQPSQY
jgi:hypothetical protein